MKRVQLNRTVAATIAMMLAGCDRSATSWTAQQDTAVCVDKTGNRVPDANCQQTSLPEGFTSHMSPTQLAKTP